MRRTPLKYPLLAGAALLLYAPPGAAQLGTSRPSFSAPAAASLGRFGEVPVSLHTGQPDISIPLFTAEGRELDLPVSLQYQSGGIRLDDVGSWVGMGWALEAGGVITRSVRGLPDDAYYGYWNTGHTFYNDANWPRPVDGFGSSYTLFENMRQGFIDGEPDQFFFNFAGRTGQFVIGPTSASSTLKEVRVTPHQNLRIVPEANFTRWVVTTEDGTRYTFAAADSALDMSGTNSGNGGYMVNSRPRFISSWHLTEIRSPGGDVIRLHYSTYIARHRLTETHGRFYLVGYINDCTTQTTNFNQYNGQEFKANRLDSITAAAHTLRFIPDATLRADALDEGGTRQEPRLAQIEVRTPAGTVLRRFVFDHDYFGGNRLRLQNVFEQDAAGASLPPWTFEYDAESFPARGSFAQDHGGYWNGKPNATLVPAAVASWTHSDGPHTASLPGADRSPSLMHARVGSLTKITYPTGGATSFTWELHEYGATRHGTTTYDAPGDDQTASVSNNTYMPTRTTTTTFTVGGTQPASVSLEVTQYCTMGMTSCAWAKITGPGIDRTFTASAQVTVGLSPGTYTLTATSPTDNRFSTASIAASWRDLVRLTGRKPGSGLRIAEVRTTDGHGGQEVRRYRYRLQSDTTRSSGMMEYEPIYMEHVFSENGAATCEYFARTATSVTPLGASSVIAYREVTVLHGENGELGRTREVFRNPIDHADGAPLTPRPNLRVTATDWRRGQRLSATEHNAAGQVQQRTASTYTFRMNDPATSRRFRGMSVSRFTGYGGYPGTGNFTAEAHYDYNAFEVISEWVHVSADSVYTYDETGTASVWTARTHTYGNPAHLQLTQLNETTSDGKHRITRMRYPADYADGVVTSDPESLTDGQAEAHALTMMKGSAHIHSPVIERWVSEVAGGTERVLQAELTTYLSFPTGTTRSYLPAGRFVFSAPGPVTDFAPASVSGGALFWDEARYQLNEQVNSYDAWGRVRELTDAAGAAYTYTYGGNANSAFLTGVSRQAPGGGVILSTTLSYDGGGNLSSIQDEGGVVRSFTYDGFDRLRQIRNHGGTPLRGFAYTYSRTASNGWTYQPGTPNSVTDTTYLQHSPTVTRTVNSQYVDGRGRPVQTVQEDGASWHVSALQYDATGRVWRVWKPYTRTTAGYDPGFAASATSFYNTVLGVTDARPYADSLFTADELRRPKSVVPEYVGASPTAAVTFAYGIDGATGQWYTETTDEAGKKSRAYVNGLGHVVRSTAGFGSAEASTAQLAFNALGQQTQLTDPRGIVTTYTRDTRGLLTARAGADAGNRAHKYDRAGNLRYTQDANQAAAGQVLFFNYDFAGRPLVSGLGAASFAALDPRALAPPALETTQGNWLVVRQYDGKPSTAAFPWSLFATQVAALTLNNVNGRLAAVASRSNGAWQAELYSYDANGQVASRHTFTQLNGAVATAVNTTVSYVRNLRDDVTQRSLTVGSSTFHQWYDFHASGELARVYASTTATKPATPDAAYTYGPTGHVRERQYQGGPVVPLRYTIREQVERIGDPASTAYPFSARYSYHANGQMQESEFYSAGSPAASKRYGYVFGAGSWDALNRLRGADYSAWTGTGWNTTAAHDLTGINYDAAGNITGLGRYQEAGLLVDNLAYGYGTANNRLGSVSDPTGTTPAPWDAETGSFTYDANGNLKTAPQPYNITAATYDHLNLPVSITASGSTTSYLYDWNGQRFARRLSSGATDFYVKEGEATLGVVTLNSALAATSWHFNLLAHDEVIGRQPGTGNRRYYHRDVLGSTRAVVEGATVVESYDYDPWGVLMPGRTLAGPTRERFTGKEQDPETGLYYFGARYYMAALARWTSVDPMADKFPGWSPYNYVEDDPLGYVDPDGMEPEQARPCCMRGLRRGVAPRYTHFRNNRLPPGTLRRHEGRYNRHIGGTPGHTLRVHVRTSRVDLRARALAMSRAAGGQVKSASRFSSERVAEQVAGQIIARNRVKIAEWQRNPSQLTKELTLPNQYMGRHIGTVARSDGQRTWLEGGYSATMVLRRDMELGFRIETMYVD